MQVYNNNSFKIISNKSLNIIFKLMATQNISVKLLARK